MRPARSLAISSAEYVLLPDWIEISLQILFEPLLSVRVSQIVGTVDDHSGPSRRGGFTALPRALLRRSPRRDDDQATRLTNSISCASGVSSPPRSQSTPAN